MGKSYLDDILCNFENSEEANLFIILYVPTRLYIVSKNILRPKETSENGTLSETKDRLHFIPHPLTGATPPNFTIPNTVPFSLAIHISLCNKAKLSTKGLVCPSLETVRFSSLSTCQEDILPISLWSITVVVRNSKSDRKVLR